MPLPFAHCRDTHWKAEKTADTLDSHKRRFHAKGRPKAQGPSTSGFTVYRRSLELSCLIFRKRGAGTCSVKHHTQGIRELDVENAANRRSPKLSQTSRSSRDFSCGAARVWLAHRHVAHPALIQPSSFHRTPPSRALKRPLRCPARLPFQDRYSSAPRVSACGVLQTGDRKRPRSIATLVGRGRRRSSHGRRRGVFSVEMR